MNDHFEKMLNEMEVPQAENGAHQLALKSALVDISRTEIKTHEKGFFTMRRKIFASAGMGLAALIAVAVSVVLLTPGSQASAAQQLAKQSSSYVAGLSPDGKAQLLQKFSTAYHADPQQLLSEAQQASDLTVLTYDQLKTEHSDIFAMLPNNRPAGAIVRTGGTGSDPGKPGPVTSDQAQPVAGDKALQAPVHQGEPPAGPPPAFPDLSSMKFLLFTDTQGQKILLGIGQDNGPVLTMTIGGNGASGSISAPNEGEAWAKPAASGGNGNGSGERCSQAGDGAVQCSEVGGQQPAG